MSDYSGLRVYRKDDLARLVLATHTASTTARPDRDEYRQGHTAALIAICLAVGVDPKAIGLLATERPSVITSGDHFDREW